MCVRERERELRGLNIVYCAGDIVLSFRPIDVTN